MKKRILYIFILFISVNTYAQHWVSFNEDTISPEYSNVRTILVTDSLLYISGSFYTGGNINLNFVGAWNGNQWDSLASGLYGYAHCITDYKEKLYFAGGVLHASNVPNTERIARWTGSNWEGLPNTYGEINSTIKAITVYKDTLIIAADAPTAAPWSGATRVTAYDADINNYVDIGKLPSTVQALEVFNGELYAGGTWYTLKKYIGGTGYGAWQNVGGDCNYYIQDLEVDTFNNFLYVAGGFYAVDDTILTDNVAIWNGYYWEKVGYGHIDLSTGGEAVTVYNVDVYLGRYSGGPLGGLNFSSSLVKWDGQDWYEVGGGTNLSVLDLVKNHR